MKKERSEWVENNVEWNERVEAGEEFTEEMEQGNKEAI